jgi:hypothetical protein
MTTTTSRHGRAEHTPGRAQGRAADRAAGRTDDRAPERSRVARVRGVLLVLLLVLGACAWAALGLDRGAAGAGEVPGAPPGTAAVRPVGTAAGDAHAAGDAPVTGSDPATGLDAELERRFAAAQAAAAAAGVDLTLTSGWRTVEEQQRLVDQAVERYGTPEAYRWVLPPEHSAHVQGLAVDVGPTDGALWLGEHGLEHGLCRTYLNEVWHFEMLPEGATACPEPHADSSWGW